MTQGMLLSMSISTEGHWLKHIYSYHALPFPANINTIVAVKHQQCWVSYSKKVISY